MTHSLSVEKYVHGHALSFTDQPHFRSLVEQLRRADKPLVVVTGSGPGRDSGLASPGEFRAQVESKTIPAGMTSQPSSNRRMEAVLAMRPTAHEMREFLYRGMGTEPGPLANSIARLIRAYPNGVRTMTTAWDESLEWAISALGPDGVEGLTLEQSDAWLALDALSSPVAVMHLGGLIPYTGSEEGVLCLSESDWVRHGAGAVDTVRRAVADCLVLVLGARPGNVALAASLLDRDVCESTAGVYWAITPDLAIEKGLSWVHSDDEARDVIWAANRLSDGYNLKPIVLKSYGQLRQLVSECALAAKVPDLYRKPDGDLSAHDSLHYGTRFSQTLKEFYRGLGASTKSGELPNKQRSQRSKQLHQALKREGGLFDFIAELRAAHIDDCAREEHFGVFLWLRDLPNGQDASYALRLMVSSTYVHWDQWSAYRIEPVIESTTSAAAAAVFYGRHCIIPIRSSSTGNPWKTALGVPFTTVAAGPTIEVGDRPRTAQLGEMMIGAVSINSDRQMPSEGLPSSELSVLSRLNAKEREELMTNLTECVQFLFSEP